MNSQQKKKLGVVAVFLAIVVGIAVDMCRRTDPPGSRGKFEEKIKEKYRVK